MSITSATRRAARRATIELSAARGTPARQAFAAWRHGFYASTAHVYDFATYGSSTRRC